MKETMIVNECIKLRDALDDDAKEYLEKFHSIKNYWKCMDLI